VVTIDELITGVAIALGSKPAADCAGFDVNGNQRGDHRRAGDCSARGPHWV
jgi:hypothetical protein